MNRLVFAFRAREKIIPHLNPLPLRKGEAKAKRQPPWTLLLLVRTNEIREGATHAVEHAGRFILRAPKRVSNARFGVTNDPMIVVRLTLGFSIGFHVFHCRTGEHSFGASDVASIRSDVDGANRTRGFVFQSNDPNGVAVLIRPQSIADLRKTSIRLVRGMARHGESAAGIKVQPRGLDCCSLG